MVPLIKFFFHEEVRRSAVQSLPEMLESAKVAADKNVHGATQQNVKQLLDFFWPALMEGLSKVSNTLADGGLDYDDILGGEL